MTWCIQYCTKINPLGWFGSNTGTGGATGRMSEYDLAGSYANYDAAVSDAVKFKLLDSDVTEVRIVEIKP